MATDTFTYFRGDVDTTLRAAYGGGTILTGRGTAELDAVDLFVRHVVKELNWLNSGACYASPTGLASSQYWFKVPDNVYSLISGYLSAAQLATVTSTAPVGFAASSVVGEILPSPLKKVLWLIGDSITACQGSTNAMQDHHFNRAVNLKAGQTLVYTENNRRSRSKDYSVMNIAISGSAFDGVDVYPENWEDAYNQHVKTIPTCTDMAFLIALGSNDASHDGSATGADIWARNQAFVGKIKTDFPNAKLIAQTLVKRTETSSLNNRLHDYNTLLRANWASEGYDALCDIEANVPQLNISTGDTTDLTYYQDAVHLTKEAYDLQIPSATAALTAIGW